MNERLHASMIGESATIREAMRSLEVSKAQVVLVVDDRTHLQGTLTDGDLRRALLAGRSLDAKVCEHMNRRFHAAPCGASRAMVLELMQARQLAQVPELDTDGRVVGLHLLSEMLGTQERPNWAVVMAGGKGARLGALTLHVPKPMLRVAGRPILERIVLHLVGNGVRRVFLAVNYLADVIEAHFRDGEGFGCRIEYLREQEPLGTGGALALLPEPPARALLVMNGDLITQTQVGRMLDFHEEGGHAVTMAVRRHVQQVPYGCVEVAGDALVGFAEKPTSEHLINTGIYALAPEVLRLLRSGEAISLPALIERVRGGGGAVRVFETDDEWIDVGQVDELSRARGLR